MSLHSNRVHTARHTHISGACYLGIARDIAAEREAEAARAAHIAKVDAVYAQVELAVNVNRYASVASDMMPGLRYDCHKATPVIVTRIHHATPRRFSVDFIYC